MNAQKVLPVALLYHADDNRIKGRTRFQKLAFLADRELQDYDIHPFDFIPYDYGPFDKNLYQVLEELQDEGHVKRDEKKTYGGDKRYDYRLSSAARETYKNDLPDDCSEREDCETPEDKFCVINSVAEDVASKYDQMPISNLIDYVYEEYPEYAENSIYG